MRPSQRGMRIHCNAENDERLLEWNLHHEIHALHSQTMSCSAYPVNCYAISLTGMTYKAEACTAIQLGASALDLNDIFDAPALCTCRFASDCSSHFDSTTNTTVGKKDLALLEKEQPEYVARFSGAYDAKAVPTTFAGALQL